jgi:hypothetical protein
MKLNLDIDHKINKCRLILVATVVATNLYAQKIFLVPHVGILQSFCTHKYNGGDNSIFTTYNKKSPEVSFLFASNILFTRKSTNFELGYKYSFSGLSVFTVPNKNTYNSSNNYSFTNYYSKSVDQHSICFNYYYSSRKIINLIPVKMRKSISLPPEEDAETVYVLSMRVKPMLGFALNIRGNILTVDDTLTEIGYNNTKTSMIFNFKDPNWYGSALQVGLCFQFYKFEKERLAFNIWYNKGLSVMEAAKYDFIVNDTSFYSTDIISRGSYLGFTASYPILLWSKKAK